MIKQIAILKAIASSILLISTVIFEAVATTSVFAEDFGKPGRFSVGFELFKIPDVTGKYPLATTVWYPAVDPAPNGTMVKATRAAVPAAAGPYPLVVLIPGFSMSGRAYDSLSQHLASHGFVVFASTYDIGPLGFRVLYNRAANVLRVINYAETLTHKEGNFAKLIDTSRVGVWGHSSGGATALQAGGARIDFKALDAWCAAHEAEKYSDACQLVGSETEVGALFGVSDPFAEPLPSLSDNRVGALILAAPGGELQVLGGRAGIAEVKVPTLIMVSSTDNIVKPEFNALWAYDEIGSQDKALVVFEKGGHMLFAYDIGPQFGQAIALATAFFLDTLKGDQAAHAALTPSEVSFPGMSYRTTRY